jgi:hypothetical protein
MNGDTDRTDNSSLLGVNSAFRSILVNRHQHPLTRWAGPVEGILSAIASIHQLLNENPTIVPTATMHSGSAHFMEKSKDQDRSKGAMEQHSENEGGNTSMQGQLGHRDQDADIKDADSDQPG